MESMPSPCFTGATSGEYVRKHNPFIVFADVTHASDCAKVEVPYPGAGGIAAALDATGAPDFVWITPNLLNDMHDGTIQAGTPGYGQISPPSSVPPGSPAMAP